MIQINLEYSFLTPNGKKNLSINTEIPEKEIIGLSGPSGAGKTTFLRILAGLETPERGKIKVGKQVFFDSEKKMNVPPQKRKLGFMFQDYALFPNMNVEQNIDFGRSHKHNPELTHRLLKIMDLQNLRKQRIYQLSGGQKQRVALARALATESSLFLLDEPLSALDLPMRTKLQEEILKIYESLQPTIFFVSHDKDEIHKLATYILQFNNDKVELLKK